MVEQQAEAGTLVGVGWRKERRVLVQDAVAE